MTVVTYSRFQQLKHLIKLHNWQFDGKPHAVPYGFKADITDGITKVHVTFYDTGKTLIQGAPGDLKNAIEAWERHREDVPESEE